MAFGGFLVLLGIFEVTIWSTSEPSIAPFGVLSLLFGGLVISAPGLSARRVVKAMRTGRIAQSEVVSVTYRRPIDRTSVDAVYHGFARGKRRVEYPGGTRIEAFESDASWASTLAPGSRLIVLTDPRRDRVLFDLGPDGGFHLAET